MKRAAATDSAASLSSSFFKKKSVTYSLLAHCLLIIKDVVDDIVSD